jgi:hypothetical protein
MNHRINRELSDAEAVVQAFANASVNFDQEIFQGYLESFPQHAERLKRYAQVWLMSNRATATEIAEQDIPMDEMLRAQSKLLALLQQNARGEPMADESEVVQRLASLTGPEGLRDLSCSLFGDDFEEDEELLAMEYLAPGLRNEPRRIQRRLANRLQCLPEVAMRALKTHQAGHQLHFSAKKKPSIREIRTWQEAVAALEISEERRRQLLLDDD